MNWGQAWPTLAALAVFVAFVGWCAYGEWWRWRNPIAAEQEDLERQRRKERRRAERRRAEMERKNL